MTPGDFSTPQITLYNMCGGFQLEGDDWNHTTRLTPSCGVKQQAAWREAADRTEQLKAPLPPPDNHNIFSPSLFLCLCPFPAPPTGKNVKGDRGEEDGVCQQPTLYLARVSRGKQSCYREPSGTADTQQQRLSYKACLNETLRQFHLPLPVFSATFAVLQSLSKELMTSNCRSGKEAEFSTSSLPQCCSACFCLQYLGSNPCLHLYRKLNLAARSAVVPVGIRHDWFEFLKRSAASHST